MESDKILNPATNRMVLRTGAIGKKILAELMHKESVKEAKEAKEEKVYKELRPKMEKESKRREITRELEDDEECKKLTQAKYLTRGSPAYHAKNCKGQQKVGNDGKMYKSTPNVKNIYTWKKV